MGVIHSNNTHVGLVQQSFRPCILAVGECSVTLWLVAPGLYWQGPKSEQGPAQLSMYTYTRHLKQHSHILQALFVVGRQVLQTIAATSISAASDACQGRPWDPAPDTFLQNSVQGTCSELEEVDNSPGYHHDGLCSAVLYACSRWQVHGALQLHSAMSDG